jgi:hypothetical protein
MLQTFHYRNWRETFHPEEQREATRQLEAGEVLYFPQLTFTLAPDEKKFLSPHYADPHAKNISYLSDLHQLWGVRNLHDEEHLQLKSMLHRFSSCAFDLIRQLFPAYVKDLIIARTSFRPQQISARKTSYRKDDKRLHVDAFPSAPNQGKRILRVFCNINPHEEDRIWRLGEPFAAVAQRFLPRLKKPLIGTRALLRFAKITKSYRTLYDHYMLQLHNHMKQGEHYQQHAPQQEVRFPPDSTWIVQTDQVSHAAMRGQYALEQTFYLPIDAMEDVTTSPLQVLERLLGRKLV